MAKKQSDIYYVPENSPVAPQKWDVRVQNRNLSQGNFTYKELEDHLNKLPDDTAHAEFRNYDTIIHDESVDTAAETTSERPEPSTTH